MGFRFDWILELPVLIWVLSSNWVALAGEPGFCNNYWSIASDCNGSVSKTIRGKMLPGKRETVVLHQVAKQMRVTGDFGNLSYHSRPQEDFTEKIRGGVFSSPKAGRTRPSGFYTLCLSWSVEMAGQTSGKSRAGSVLPYESSQELGRTDRECLTAANVPSTKRDAAWSGRMQTPRDDCVRKHSWDA